MPVWCRNVNSVPGKILLVGTNMCSTFSTHHLRLINNKLINKKEITLTVLYPPDILADTVTPYNVRTHTSVRRLLPIINYFMQNENVTFYS